MKNKLFRSVPVLERLPAHGGYILTDIGLVQFFPKDKSWLDDEYFFCSPDHWLEPIELPTDPANLSSSLLANAIVGLDKEGARGLVKELCQHFGLLPSEEETYTHAAEVECKQDEELDAFRDGANFILNLIKGGGE